jgi:hypothetical protein
VREVYPSAWAGEAPGKKPRATNAARAGWQAAPARRRACDTTQPHLLRYRGAAARRRACSAGSAGRTAACRSRSRRHGSGAASVCPRRRGPRPKRNSKSRSCHRGRCGLRVKAINPLVVNPLGREPAGKGRAPAPLLPATVATSPPPRQRRRACRDPPAADRAARLPASAARRPAAAKIAAQATAPVFQSQAAPKLCRSLRRLLRSPRSRLAVGTWQDPPRPSLRCKCRDAGHARH